MQRILITGGLGFIGSNFILYLLENEPGLHIDNLDKLTYAGNPLNLKHVEGDARYTLIKGDVADRELVERLLGENHYDAIAHLAAESHVDRAIQSSAPFVLSNVVGTQVLLDAALKHSVPRFLMVSTDEVYGSLGPAGEFTEQSPLAPNNPYSATKAAVLGLTRSNAIEFARFGATVNAVCPGPIETDMMAAFLSDERFKAKMLKGVPARRVGQPEDVAAAVAFFALEESSYVTGNILVVDGGMTLKAL